MQKKEAAFIMYQEGASQKEIAKMLRVSENTISTWSKSGNWKQKKISQEIKHENSIEAVIELIEYQTDTIKRIKDSWIEEDPESMNLIDKGHIDALSKLYSCIRRDVKKFTDFVHVMSEYMTWLKSHDLDIAQKMTEINTQFLNEMRQKF